jgi:hypothetical protein
MKLRVAYTGFWAGFEAKNFLFTKVLENILQYEVEIVNNKSEYIDLEFLSVFSFDSKFKKAIQYTKGQFSKYEHQEYIYQSRYGFSGKFRSKAKKTIWYSGENIRPPFDEFDATISFDKDDPEINNLYFPVWYFLLNWRLGDDKHNRKISINQFTLPRSVEERDKSACAFSTSRDPARLKTYAVIKQVMPLTIYGRSVGNFVADKIIASTNFGFQVCPENDVYPGYVTEKIPEAYLAGNIPIWIGSDVHCTFNKNAYVDITGLNSYETRELLQSIDSEKARWIRNQPLLLAAPNLDGLTSLFLKVLS